MSQDRDELPQVRFPDGVLDTNFIGEWSFEEFLLLVVAVVVGLTPYLTIEAIGVFPGLVMAGGAALVTLAVIRITPEEKPPLHWLSLKLRNRIFPDRYVLRPRHDHRSPVDHQAAHLDAEPDGKTTQSEQSSSAGPVEQSVDDSPSE